MVFLLARLRYRLAEREFLAIDDQTVTILLLVRAMMARARLLDRDVIPPGAIETVSAPRRREPGPREFSRPTRYGSSRRGG
jgi:hypothetical protein